MLVAFYFGAREVKQRTAWAVLLFHYGLEKKENPALDGSEVENMMGRKTPKAARALESRALQGVV